MVELHKGRRVDDVSTGWILTALQCCGLKQSRENGRDVKRTCIIRTIAIPCELKVILDVVTLPT